MKNPKAQDIEMVLFTIKDGLHHTWVNLSFFFIYLIATAGVMHYLGVFKYAKYSIYSGVYFGSLFFVLFLKFIIYLIKNDIVHGYIFEKHQAIQDLKSNWFKWQYLIVIFVPFMTVLLLMSIFGSMKTLLVVMNPFSFDEVFMEIDKFIHFGYQPWELTHMLFGSPLITWIIDLVYQSWFILLMGFTMWMIVSHKLGVLRAKFLLTYLFIWAVMGSFLALGLSSAGPCYYKYFTKGVDIYLPLMQRLQTIGDIYKDTPESFGLFSLDNQARLWLYFTDDFIGLGSGISAMPSMHVSFAMLFFLTIRQMNKWAGYAALGFLVITQIGSVHLGWHYAIDGYVSIILTYFLWRLADYIIELYDKRNKNISLKV